MKACNCTNKNWHLVCDSCGGNLPSCLDCTDTERQLKEARAEIDKLNAIADMQRARLGKREEAIAERDKLIAQMTNTLRSAEQFIENGIEFGYIRMPDPETPDKAHKMLPEIKAALSAAERGRK